MIEHRDLLIDTKTAKERCKKALGQLINYDPGINQPRKFNGFADEPAVKIFTRQALLSEVQDRLSNKPESRTVFLKLDIADFYQANLSVDKEGNRAADLVLNRFAGRLNNLAAWKGNQYESMVCRYGGDEFVIALVGDYDEKNISHVVPALKQQLEKQPVKTIVSGSQAGRFEEKPLRLKNDQIEIISRPDAGFDRAIFDYFLGSNQILDTAAVETIKRLYGSEGNFRQGIEILKKNGKARTDLNEKTAYLKKRYPELKNILNDIPQFFANPDDQEEIINYVEKRKFDGLIGEAVYSSSEFFARMDGYEHVVCLDLKFIKEINDTISFVDGDKSILSLWQKINFALSDDIKKVDIGRRGGTFYFGLPSGAEKNKEIVKKLRSITDFSILIKNISIPFKLEVYGSDLSIHKQDDNKKTKLNELDKIAEDRFYDYLIDYLLTEKKDGSHKHVDVFFSRFLNPTIDLTDRLINSFFISNRAGIRSSKIIKRLEEDPKFIDKRYSSLKNIMKKLYELSQLEKYKGGKHLDQLATALKEVFLR